MFRNFDEAKRYRLSDGWPDCMAMQTILFKTSSVTIAVVGAAVISKLDFKAGKDAMSGQT